MKTRKIEKLGMSEENKTESTDDRKEQKEEKKEETDLVSDYLSKVPDRIIAILERPSSSEITMDIFSVEEERNMLRAALILKQLQMRHGEIWQMVIGTFPGFTDLHVGHESGLDILSKERKLAIELKNSFNTDNSSSRKSNFDKLAAYQRLNPDYTIIYGIVNERNGKSIKKTITHRYLNETVTIQYYSGKSLFSFLWEGRHQEVVDRVVEVVATYKKKYCSK